MNKKEELKVRMNIGKEKIIFLVFLFLSMVALSFIFIQNNSSFLGFEEKQNQDYRKIYFDNIYNPDAPIDRFNELFGITYDLDYSDFCSENDNSTSLDSKWMFIFGFDNNTDKFFLSSYSKNCTQKSFFSDDGFNDSEEDYDTEERVVMEAL
jgi:hypothetical protein